MFINCQQIFKIYLNPIAACQTKANNKKKTGIIGNTSTIGLNMIYASGNRANNKLSISKISRYVKLVMLNILNLIILILL